MSRTITKKMKAYIQFQDSLITSNQIKGRIHYIVSEEIKVTTEAKEQMNWGDVTQGEYVRYTGMGKHEEMLTTEYVTENAKILNEIVEIIKRRAEQSKK